MSTLNLADIPRCRSVRVESARPPGSNILIQIADSPSKVIKNPIRLANPGKNSVASERGGSMRHPGGQEIDLGVAPETARAVTLS
jgi:hypothetical protein